jgi:hypothetical protein
MLSDASALRVAHAACFVLVASALTYCLLELRCEQRERSV